MDSEIPALKVATDVLRLALVALDLALTEHPKDDYLQGQAREHVWKSYWELRTAAGDPPTGAHRDLDRLLGAVKAAREIEIGNVAKTGWAAPHLRRLYKLAEEIEDGHREKEGTNG